MSSLNRAFCGMAIATGLFGMLIGHARFVYDGAQLPIAMDILMPFLLGILMITAAFGAWGED